MTLVNPSRMLLFKLSYAMIADVYSLNALQVQYV